MNIKIRFIFRTIDETFECLDDNFSINIDNENINDFSKAIDSKFTKTLKLAGTERAVAFFKEYYEVRYEGENDFSFIFNSRTGEHCIIYVDDVEVMQGVALLTGITRNKNLNIFEIQVINDVKDILNEFKNLYIDELDDYDYVWTFANVKTLLNTTVNDTFIGVAMSDGECVSQKNISGSYTTAIDISKIPIAANLKKILDKGFEKIGVQYQSSFLNSDRLKALWLCNNKSENLGIWGDSDKILLDFFYNNVTMLDYLPFQLSELTYTDIDNNNYKVYINKYDRNISKWDLMHGWSSFYGQSKYTNFEITVNTSESDELDSYVNGATRHIYLVGNCKYRINLDLENYGITGATANKWRGHIIFRFTDLATNQVETLNYYTDDFMNYSQTYSKNITFEKELEHNCILDIYVQEDIALHENYWDDENEKMFVIDSSCDSISINVRKIAGSQVRLQGSTINLYSQLPHISLYDVIVNLQKMFNLVFSLDKDSEKLVIEPEVDYYKLNEDNLIDITDLVDYSQDIIIEPASTLIDYNKISAKYNISDKDFHNSYCLSQYGRAFGEFKTEFESYTKGELEIKNDFTICKAATYIYNDYYTFTASYENENGNLKKVSADKCFIGVRKVHTHQQVAERLYLWYNENIYSLYGLPQINILDFCSSNFDYCYDTPRVVFSSMDDLPIDNLFYTYYFKVLQEYIQLSGKIVRLKCYFDPITFSTLSKKRVVYWENNYWKLLKVSDWSPAKPVVDVVLLKMIDVEVPAIQPKPHIPDVQWILGGFVRPAQVDIDNLSVTMLDTLSKVGALISNKAGSVNLNEIADAVRYLTDGISKYDKYDYSIVECLLAGGTEIAFPDYTNFNGFRAWPVVEIKNTAFQNIRFTGDFKMNNLEVVNEYEFVESIFDGIFEGIKIKSIGSSAFKLSNFSGSLSLPVCTYVGQYAFFFSDFIGELSLPVCTYVGIAAFTYSNFSGELSLPVCTYVGDAAFYYSDFIGELNLPSCTYVGQDAFYSSNFSGSLNLPVCTYVGQDAFYSSNFSGELSLPSCTFISYNAFLNSNFTQITIGANAELYSNCIGAHSIEFLDDYNANGKLAGTYVWNGSHWIYQ